MSDEYEDDGLEPSEQEQAVTAANAGFEGLPKETQAEIRKLRKDDQKHREERRTLQKELLTAKYGDEVTDLIPPEVTDYARQTELAEKLRERLAASPSTQTQAGEPPAEEAEPPTPQEQQLATAIGGPATGTSSVASDVSDAEIMRIGRKDPAAAAALIAAKAPKGGSLEDHR